MNFHPVQGFHLARRGWFRVIETFLRDERIKAVQNERHLAHETACKAVVATRTVMTDDVPELMYGIREADETYVGGAWKNKAIHIRKQGAKRGRETSKQPIFRYSACRRGTGRVFV